METSEVQETLANKFLTKFRKLVVGIDVQHLKNVIHSSYNRINNNNILNEKAILAVDLKTVINDLRSVLITSIDDLTWTLLEEDHVLDDVFVILYFLMTKAKQRMAATEDKVNAIQAAELVVLLYLLPREMQRMFHIEVHTMCLYTLKLTFPTTAADYQLYEPYVCEMLYYFQTSATKFKFNVAILYKFAYLLVTLTETKAYSTVVNFDNSLGSDIRSQAFKCLNVLSHVAFGGPELFNPFIAVYLQAFSKHIIEIDNTTINPFMPMEKKYICCSTINYLLTIQKKFIVKFENFLHFAHKLCLEAYSEFGSPALVDYLRNLILNVPNDCYIAFINWYKRLIYYYEPKVRAPMHEVIFTILTNKPANYSEEAFLANLSQLFEMMAESCLDIDDHVQSITIRNMDKLFGDTSNQYLRTAVVNVFEHPSDTARKMLQILEILIFNDKKKTLYIKSFVNILYNILLINKKWIVAKTINMFVTLFDSANNALVEKYILALVHNIFKKYQTSSAAMALFVSIFIPEVLAKNGERHSEFTAKVAAEFIFGGMVQPDLKYSVWLMINFIMKQNFRLDEVMCCLSKEWSISINVGKSIIEDIDKYELAARVLGSLAKHISGFQQELGQDLSARIVSLFSSYDLKTLAPTKYTGIEKLLTYFSYEHISALEVLLNNGLDKSEIPLDSIPSAVSLLANLTYTPANTNPWKVLAGLQKNLERRVFNNLSRLVNKFKNEEFEMLLRDLLALGHAGMRSNIMADATTCGLLALFVTPGHHGGLGDFFGSLPKAWTICIQSYGRLCMRDTNKLPTCTQVMRKCIRTDVPAVQIQALFILYDICAINNASYKSLRDDLFYVLSIEHAQVRMASLEMIIKLHKRSLIKFESFQHLQFILGLCDEYKPIVNMIEICIDEKYCEANHKFIVDDLIKIVVLNNMCETDPMYAVDKVNLRLSSLSLENKKFIYYILCCQLTPEHKLTLIGYVVRMFIDAYCDGLFDKYSDPETILKESIIILLCALPNHGITKLSNTYHDTLNLILMRRDMFLRENRTYVSNQKKKRKPEKKNAFLTKKPSKDEAIISHLITSIMKLWEIINKENKKITYGVVCVLIHTINTYSDQVVQLLLENEDVQAFLEMVHVYIMSVDFQRMLTEDDERCVYVVKLDDISHWSVKEERIRKQQINSLKRSLNCSCIKYL